MQEFECDVIFSFNLINNFLDTDNLLNGKLYVSNKNDIYIHYIDNLHLNNEKDFMKITVYGQTAKNGKFTAHNCYKENSVMHIKTDSLSIVSTDIKISKLFFGDWIPDINNLKIQSAKVRFSYLEHWLQRFYIDDDKKNFSVDTKQFDLDFNAKISDNLTIKTSCAWQRSVDGNKKLIFNIAQFFKYNFDKTISFEEYNKLNYTLQNFFRFILPKVNVFIEEQSIKVKDKDIEIYNSNELYTKENNKIFRNHFLYLYNKETISQTLIAWFDFQDKFGSVADNLATILDNFPLNEYSYEFLNVIHWCESYVRVEYPASEKEKNIFKDRIQNIISQIKNNEDKELIENKTKYDYEYSLRRQLKNIFTDTGMKDILAINKDVKNKLIDDIVTTRDKLTHKNADDDLDVIRTYRLTRMLEKIILLVLIKKINLNVLGVALDMQILRPLTNEYEALYRDNKNNSLS